MVLNVGAEGVTLEAAGEDEAAAGTAANQEHKGGGKSSGSPSHTDKVHFVSHRGLVGCAATCKLSDFCMRLAKITRAAVHILQGLERIVSRLQRGCRGAACKTPQYCQVTCLQVKKAAILPLAKAQVSTTGSKAAACAQLQRLADASGSAFKAPTGVVLPFGCMELAIKVCQPCCFPFGWCC